MRLPCRRRLQRHDEDAARQLRELKRYRIKKASRKIFPDALSVYANHESKVIYCRSRASALLWMTLQLL